MTERWRETTLGAVCDDVCGTIQTGPFGSQLHESDYSSEGIPVVMPKDIVANRIATAGIARVQDEHVERLAKHKLEPGDIVYGRRGDIGRQALVQRDQAGWLCGTGCLRISLGSSVIDPTFLHYYLQQQAVISWIRNQAIGATMPNLNTSILRRVPVRFPSLSMQRKIGATLSAYDDLIDNNTRRIRILEEMARALYREWFIEFRYTGYEQVDLVKTPIGKSPKGWVVRPVTDCVYVNPRVVVPQEGEKPFVPMTSLANDSMMIAGVETRGGNSGARFQNGDTLFARITPCLENGKTGFVQFLPDDSSVAFGSTEFIVLRSSTLSPEFVYLLARSTEFRENAIKSMTGASGRQRVQEGCFGQFLMPVPPDALIKEFSEIVSPMFRLIQKLHLAATNLREARDLLLPRLLSGGMELPTAEAVA